MKYLEEGEGAVLADVAVAGEATAPASCSHSWLIMGALEHLFKTGCGRGGSTSIEELTN